MKSCLVIAGEKSGEEHCLSFLPKLKELSPNTNFFGVGGDDMKQEGVELLYHLKDFSSMGFAWDVLKKIPFYFKALDHVVAEVQKRKCKHAILIDFQGFNLKLARKLEEIGVHVLYYVAPQAWAWKEGRIKILQKCTHTLFTILPFEKKWFGDRGVKNIVAVKHPLLDHYQETLSSFDRSLTLKEEVNILVLPGSRNSEVSRLLPIFIKTLNAMRGIRKVKAHIVTSDSVSDKYYEPFLESFDKVYDSKELSAALMNTDICLASSGTVTLTCALFSIPTIVCYQMSLFNEFVIRNFMKYTWHISLGNIVNDERIFPELVQGEVESNILTRYLLKYLDEKLYKDTVVRLNKTKELLKGDEIDTASYMAGILNGSNN
jgi:lipid-A-disaccharide synthase